MRSLPLFSALVLVVSASTSDAQILRSIQKKAADAVAQKAEAKLDQKIQQMADKMVDGTYDAMFGDLERSAGARAGSAASPFSMGNAATEERYQFSLVVAMDVETRNANGASAGKAQMRMHFNPAEQYTGTLVVNDDTKKSGGEAFVIFDAKHESMVMLMQSEGNKFSMAYGWKDAAKAAESATAGEPVDWDKAESWKNWTRIGTKTIAGYSATGYRSTDAEHTVELWVTRDRALTGAALFGANANLKQMRGRMPTDVPAGLLLAMTSTETKSGEQVTMTVTNIDTKANVSYTMSDYPRVGAAAKK
jgi:hypothetical protein